MTILASVGILLGEVVLLLDLGNRLFGSYTRTPIGSLARIVLIVVLALLLAAPLMWIWVDDASILPRYVLFSTGVFGCVMCLHFVIPYRWGIAAVPGAASTSSRMLVPGIRFSDFTLSIPSLPEEADGMAILVMSDLHCNTQEDLNRLRDAIKNLPPGPVDVVFHLGDFGENKSLLADVISTVAAVPSRRGAYCVLGNHDYEGGRESLIHDLLGQHSVAVLANESRFIAELKTWVLGLAYPWTRGSLPGQSNQGLVLCLTHSPDNIVHFPKLNVALGFAGHTHGGKLRIRGFGAVLVPSRWGRFLTEGWFRCGESLLYLTSGIGYFPGRLGNVGEIACVRLRRIASTAAS